MSGSSTRFARPRSIPAVRTANITRSRSRVRLFTDRSNGILVRPAQNRGSASWTCCQGARSRFGWMDGDDGNQNFRDDVIRSLRVDPRPTLENLATSTSLTYEQVAHHALVRYASSGAEALLALEPQALRQLIDAAKAGEWAKVGAIIEWLEAGLE